MRRGQSPVFSTRDGRRGGVEAQVPSWGAGARRDYRQRHAPACPCR